MRRLTVRTDHGDGERAAAVAAAVRPDNTPAMTTSVDGTAVETTIERATTGGLQSTADDYIVNITTATRLLETDNP